MTPLDRCRRELAALADLCVSGHPDRHGIRLAISDWMMEEAILMGTEPIKDIIDDGVPPITRQVRRFSTGATRDSDEGKPRYCGFNSPLVEKRFGEYMHKHRHLPDGTIRDADNWKKGMPPREVLESMMRHLVDLWLIVEGYSGEAREDALTAACALRFGTNVLMHDLLKGE